MALPPITPPGSPSIQPLTGGPANTGLPTPPQTPQKSGVVDFGKIPPLSLDNKKVEEPAENEEDNKGAFRKKVDEVAKEVGEDAWMIPGLSSVAKGISKGDAGVGGALEGAAGGVVDVTKNNLESLKGLPTSPTQALVGAYGKNIENSDSAPDWAKKVAEKTT